MPRERAKVTTRLTPAPGKNPIVKMPCPATDRSLEKATTWTFAARAAGATAVTEADSSGPRISDAPAPMARAAASAAPTVVPLVSWINSSKRSSARSNRASWAAFTMASPRRALRPERGTSNATRTADGVFGGGAGARTAAGGGPWPGVRPRKGVSDGECAPASRAPGRGDGAGGTVAGGSGRGRCTGVETAGGFALPACIQAGNWRDSHAHSNSPTAASHGAKAQRDHKDRESIIRRSETSFKVGCPDQVRAYPQHGRE